MRFKRIASASLTGLVVAVGIGCSGVREGSAEHTQTLQEHLFEGSGVTLWKNGVVPVCYSTTDGNNSNLRTQAQTILADWGWSAVANVQFTGWGACGSNPIAGGQVKLHFVPGSAQFGNGNTDRSGGGGSVFTNVYLVSDDAVGNSFRHEVLHEFGHVLGWDHEQQSTYNWPNGPDGGEAFCKKNQTDDAGKPTQILDDTKGTALTKYFDGESVMSYCAPNTIGLSPGDVAGVQAAYGLPPYPVRGHNGSNNAVSQSANALNTFFVHADGSVWTTWGPAGAGKWPEGQLPGAGPGTAVGGPIAAVSRSPVNLDIFYAGRDGAIHTNYWLSGTPWASQTIPAPGVPTSGEQVAAVSGSPSEIDVFFAGIDKNIYWSRWSGLQSIPGQWTTVKWTGSVPVGAAISAVARTPDRLDVFYIGTDGAPHWSNCSAFGTTGPGTCTAANAGQFGSSALTASTECLAPPGGGIAATAATANNMDIFYANKNGGICTNSWTAAGGWTNREIVAPAQAHMGQGTVAAVSRQPTTLDVFWIATNSTSGKGELHTAWGSPGGSTFGTGQNDTNYVGTNPGGAPVPGGPLGVAARTKDNLDEFEQRAASGAAIAQDTSYWFTGASGWTTYTTVVYVVSPPTVAYASNPMVVNQGRLAIKNPVVVTNANGQTTPTGFSIKSGSLPPGMKIDAISGAISGTPTPNGKTVPVSYSATIFANGVQAFTEGITVNPSPVGSCENPIPFAGDTAGAASRDQWAAKTDSNGVVVFGTYSNAVTDSAGNITYQWIPYGTICPSGTLLVKAYCPGFLAAGNASDPLSTKIYTCSYLQDMLIWENGDGTYHSYQDWTNAQRARLDQIYSLIQSGAADLGLDCPDPSVNLLAEGSASPLTANPPENLFFSANQAFDTYAASVAWTLYLEAYRKVPWSIFDHPAQELGEVFDSRSHHTRMPRVNNCNGFANAWGSAFPEAMPTGLSEDQDFLNASTRYSAAWEATCDPREGYQFLTGARSSIGANLIGATELASLQNITGWVYDNVVHGSLNLTVADVLNTHTTYLAGRLASIAPTGGVQASWGCHSTANFFYDLAKSINIPLLHVASDEPVVGVYPTPTQPYVGRCGAAFAYNHMWINGDRHSGVLYGWGDPGQTLALQHTDDVYAMAPAFFPLDANGSPVTNMGQAIFSQLWLPPSLLSSWGYVLTNDYQPVTPLSYWGDPDNTVVEDQGYFFGYWVPTAQGKGLDSYVANYLGGPPLCSTNGSWGETSGFCSDPNGPYFGGLLPAMQQRFQSSFGQTSLPIPGGSVSALSFINGLNTCAQANTGISDITAACAQLGNRFPPMDNRHRNNFWR